MVKSDFSGLPWHTQQFIERIHLDGLDRTRIHGLFVMLGICAGVPDTQDSIDERFRSLNSVIPIDRYKQIDEAVGHIYGGYDNEINEFCYRSGAAFEFREIKIPESEKSFSIVYLKDEGLFDLDVVSINNLADSSRLYDAFIAAIGSYTANRNASLIDAFSCGIFQIQLHAQIDVYGARQIVQLIKLCLPLIYSQYVNTLQSNHIEYFLGLQTGQVALLALMQPMEIDYAKQMWGFQSRLFYRNQEPINGINDLGISDWHAWVLENARMFDIDYPTELVPFTRSNITLTDVPHWQSAIADFDNCDTYIRKTWGYNAVSLRNYLEIFEYKALLVHLVYASLTSARERVH